MTRLFLHLLIMAINICGCKALPLLDSPRESDYPGRYHVVKPNDTLSALAKRYNLSVEEIKDTNGIENERALKIGSFLFMPEPDPLDKKLAGLKPKLKKPQAQTQSSLAKIKPKNKEEKIFDFPVDNGKIVQHFSSARAKPYDGIAIKAPRGSAVKASADGRILFVGDDGTKFGLIVIIEHKQPYITIYTHLDSHQVKIGQITKSKDVIGTVGTSGGVAFPHLHFQIRIDQRPYDPEAYLKEIY